MLIINNNDFVDLFSHIKTDMFYTMCKLVAFPVHYNCDAKSK